MCAALRNLAGHHAMNPVSYFEIPVLDLHRAMQFYSTVFGSHFEQALVDGNEMAFFMYDDALPGASGALAQGESYVPSQSGVRLYFDVSDIQQTIERALSTGSILLYPITPVGGFGSVAEITDSEGNCIGLHAAL